jgi:hypothetical protein
VGVATHLHDVTSRVDAVVAAEGIGLQMTAETLEEQARAVSLMAPREIKNIVRIKIIAEVDPEPGQGLDLSLRIPQLHRRVVGVNRAAQQDQCLHQVVERLETLGGAGHPVAEG